MTDAPGITGQQVEENLLLSKIGRCIFENIGIAAIIAGKDMAIHLVNTNFKKLFGYSRKEIEGKKSLMELFAKDYLAQEHLRLWFKNPGAVPGQLEACAMDKYGHVKNILLNIAAIHETREYVVSLIDITTGYKKAEADRRLWEKLYSVVFNASPYIMTLTTLTEGLYIDVNRSFIEITGYQPYEVIGRTAGELNVWVVPENRAKIVGLLQNERTIRNFETEFRSKSGKIMTTLYSAELIILNGVLYIMSSINDITRYKQMEQEMAHLDRLHLAGEMAAGISHEVRNPITTVRGFLQLLKKKKECEHYNNYFDLMIEELDRANSIIAEFLSLARDNPVSLKTSNINHIVTAIYPLIMADALVTNKYVEMVLSNDVPHLQLNEKEIRQLIFNLTRNGIEAMAPGGKLTVKTFVDGNQVVLAVQDEGHGIEPNLLKKLDTPFFTTKENGTGLGLPVCYRIAARHNAVIKIETGPAGTAFIVRFKNTGL